MIGFALGNGKSRLNIDLEKLKTAGRVYGCNALYRDYSPDVLISTDPPISEEIQASGYPLTNVHYTRHPSNGSGSLQIDEKCRGWSSGPIAIRYACKECTTVYLIGFDLTSPDNKINNIYAGTDCYKPANSSLTYYGNWVGQVKRVWNEFPGVNFVRVTTDYTTSPTDWINYEKYSEMDINDFISWLNKQ